MTKTSSKQLGIEVRRLQQKCKLSCMQADHVASLLATHVKKPNLREADRELKRECGVTKQELNGCISCNEHVFEQKDKSLHCPKCGHSRYQDDGKTANEIVYYFPVYERFKALLQLPNFLKLLQVINIFKYMFLYVPICHLSFAYTV